MKIFQCVRNKFGILGIYQPQPNVPILNQRNSIAIVVYIQFLILTMKFLIFETQTFRELADSVFITVTCILKVICFAVTLWKISDIFDLMDNFEGVIQERKLIFQFNFTFFL